MHIKSLIQTILLQNKKLILFLNKKAFTPLYICNIFDSKYGAIYGNSRISCCIW
jgi:hypothetical protein